MSSHDENPASARPGSLTDDPRTWTAAPVWGEDHQPLGHVAGLFFHPLTQRATWMQVSDGTGVALVPLDHASADASGVRVPYRFEQLATAPRPHPGSPELDASVEQVLYQHYGVTARALRDHRAATDGQIDPAPVRPGDGSMVRSEERLHVRRPLRPYRRLRLVTYVVTEDVTFTVPVSRQEIRLEEIPLVDTDADTAGGAPVPGELAADVHEVVLHREEVSFSTRVVPVERVRLVRHIVTGEQVVSAERRAEQIDLVRDPMIPVSDSSTERQPPPSGGRT